MAKQSEKKLEEVRENWNRLEDLASARLVSSEITVGDCCVTISCSLISDTL